MPFRFLSLVGHPSLRVVAALVCVLAVLMGGGSWQSGAPPATPSAELVAAQGDLPTPIQHVFLIMMENEGVQQVVGGSGVPYQTYLANTYAWGGDALKNGGVGYYSICHPSTGNYIGLTSGLPLHCGS
ncbi:MAG: hypothetical protein WB873_02275, partial [Thermoplasmata archaeon]